MTTTYPLEPDGYPDDGPIDLQEEFDRAIAGLLRRTTTCEPVNLESLTITVDELLGLRAMHLANMKPAPAPAEPAKKPQTRTTKTATTTTDEGNN